MSDVALWTPSAQQIERSAMADFSARVSKAHWSELYAWSTLNYESFWREFLDYSEIIFQGSAEEVFRPSARGKFYGGTWFPSVKLNYAENLLKSLGETPLVAHSESTHSRSYTKEEVVDAVRKLQSFFVDKGVRSGDVVAALVSNNAEAIFSMLAATSLGAIWSSCSPEFGVKGILDRFSQIEPKVLLVQGSYDYNGKHFDLSEKNEEVAEGLPTVELLLNVQGNDFKNLLEGDRSHELEFKHFEFSHPLYILFSSGTTGVPKCIVHSAGGSLLQHYKELKLHCDLKNGEDFAYYTTTGWMMWNWMVSALGCGARVHTYDGAPFRKDGWSLWDWAQKAKLKVFGTSARFIGACRTQGLKVFEETSSLRLVLSTGSPLLPEDFDYFYSQKPASDSIQLASISGGTDIVSCFMLGNPILPVYRGEIQSAGLGMAIRAFNDSGKNVVDEQGELVCVKPFPSMPLYFLNDNNNERYEAAYFDAFPGVWHHGDYITITKKGGIIVHGRSDATLNPGGVRIGTAEIYRQVETHPKIKDSLVVGKIIEGDEKVVLFVLLKEGAVLDAQLEQELRTKIKTGASPRHVPYKIVACPDIPYTLSGKKVEIAVKKLLEGVEPKNTEALSNPDSLNFYREGAVTLFKS